MSKINLVVGWTRNGWIVSESTIPMFQKESRYYHPQAKIYINNPPKTYKNWRDDVRTALMLGLQTHGLRVSELSYKKTQFKRKSKPIHPKQLALL